MTLDMDEQRLKKRRVNELLHQIDVIDGRVSKKQVRLNDRIKQAAKKYQDQYGPEIDALNAQKQPLVDELIKLVVPNFLLWTVKNTRTIKFRAGQIAYHRGRAKLVVTHSQGEAAVIQRFRELGKLGRYVTKKVEYSLNKEALKKDPDYVKKTPGIEIVHEPSLLIRLPKTQGELTISENDFRRLRVSLPKGIDGD